MKKYASIIIAGCMIMGMVLGGFTSVFADEQVRSDEFQDEGSRNQRRPPRGESLTDDQKAEIVSILSQYDSDSLTADDAHAIHRAFRKAGIRPRPGMRETIESAGFDPEKLRSLDPPPCRKGPPPQESAGPPSSEMEE